MTGKDLFASLNYVDDALIEEAETYAPARILPLKSVRRAGALAACICVLVGLTAAIRLGLFGGGKNEAMDSGAMMYTESFAESEAACAEEAETEEEMPEIETGEGAADTEKEDALATNTTTGAQPTDKPVADTKADYYVINDAASEASDEKLRVPENGEWVCEFGLREQVMTILRVQNTPTMAGNTRMEARFLAAFTLLKDGEEIDEDSEEYLLEVQRLTDLGYEFRRLAVKGDTKDVKTRICGLFTAEQLDEFTAQAFDASEKYGYIFCFPKNEDGTPLEWDDTAELCGLPTVE